MVDLSVNSFPKPRSNNTGTRVSSAVKLDQLLSLTGHWTDNPTKLWNVVDGF